jgi:hypothetical protein
MESVRAGIVSEVVVVDDASNDRTAELASKEGAHVIPLPGNGGKGTAVFEGLLHCKRSGAEAVVLADADLLSGFTPRQVAYMLEQLEISHVGKDGKLVTIDMAIHPQTEDNRQCPIPFSGFRAIRLSALNFLFVKDAKGIWQHANSKPARRFREAGANTSGLELALRWWLEDSTRNLAEEHGQIMTKIAFRGSGANRALQENAMRDVMRILWPRDCRAYDIRRARREEEENRQAEESMRKEIGRGKESLQSPGRLANFGRKADGGLRQIPPVMRRGQTVA